MAATKKRASRLGRGLSSLMSQPVAITSPPPEVPPEVSPEDSSADAVETAEVSATFDNDVPRGTSLREGDGPGLSYLSVDAIGPNPHQPRQKLDEASLAGLAASIRNDGLMQPIVVRPRPDEAGRYELVAGERRWRAARLAGLDALPALVRDLDEQQLAEWALIENLQREDLNPMDRAEAFGRLADQFGLSHDQIARRLGLERSSVSNHLRLLNLTKPVQILVAEGHLSMGQARALAALDDHGQQQRLAELAVKAAWSVRRVEAAVKRLGAAAPGRRGGARSGGGALTAARLADLERQITEQLGTRARVRAGRKKGSGALTLEFYTLDQFDTLMKRLGVKVG